MLRVVLLHRYSVTTIVIDTPFFEAARIQGKDHAQTPYCVHNSTGKQERHREKAALLTPRREGTHEEVDGAWTLTSAGEALGGAYIESKEFGRYVGWPEDFDPASLDEPAPTPIVPSPSTSGSTLTATALGNHFGISANKCNYILSELGWVKKGLRGWLVTDPGLRIGGKQAERSSIRCALCPVARFYPGQQDPPRYDGRG